MTAYGHRLTVGGKDDPRVAHFLADSGRKSVRLSRKLPPALRAFPDPLILDGEILAWSPDTAQALPFLELQKTAGSQESV